MKATVILTAASLLLLAGSASAQNNYGVDVSFPIHYNFVGSDDLSATNEVFGNDRVDAYSKYMQGCINRYGGHEANSLCRHNDAERLMLNLDQPKLQTNYTDIGFKKTKLSDETWDSLKTFWAGVKAKEGFPNSLSSEAWPEANTYVNHWETASKLHPLDNKLGSVLWDEIEQKMQEWIPTASSFSKSSLYGVRVYREGHILAPHVDRDPLISSAIVNIDQEVTDPWPLEVIGHDGFAYNITISPGEVILYESHSIIHGRPFALKGSYYANIFVHFKPEFDDDEEEEDTEAVDYSSSNDSSTDDDESRDEL